MIMFSYSSNLHQQSFARKRKQVSFTYNLLHIYTHIFIFIFLIRLQLIQHLLLLFQT